MRILTVCNAILPISCFLPDSSIEYGPVQLIQIYFDTATFDEIERDVMVTLEDQLGLIGGTMGLLTGFSILSGVKILYFALKLLMSLKSYWYDGA